MRDQLCFLDPFQIVSFVNMIPSVSKKLCWQLGRADSLEP